MDILITEIFVLWATNLLSFAFSHDGKALGLNDYIFQKENKFHTVFSLMYVGGGSEPTADWVWATGAST